MSICRFPTAARFFTPAELSHLETVLPHVASAVPSKRCHYVISSNLPSDPGLFRRKTQTRTSLFTAHQLQAAQALQTPSVRSTCPPGSHCGELKDERIQVLSCSVAVPDPLRWIVFNQRNEVKAGSLQEPRYDNFFNFGEVGCPCQCSSHSCLTNSNTFSLPFKFDQPSSLEAHFRPPYT